jgi:hypothetical protein
LLCFLFLPCAADNNNNNTTTQLMWGWLLPMLRQTLWAVTNECLPQWSSAVRFCMYDKDPRRLYP